VTLSDNGSTFHFAVGSGFQLDLGDSLTWVVTVADSAIVARIPGAAPSPGSQGFYEARAPGSTAVSAVGSAPCSSEPCPLFRVGFRITVVVG
jgi:hypothetical protein